MNKLWSKILSGIGLDEAAESAVKTEDLSEVLNFEPEPVDAPEQTNFSGELDRNQLAMIQISSCGHVIAS